jgi:O-antigen/teichoic acid export membrane protein
VRDPVDFQPELEVLPQLPLRRRLLRGAQAQLFQHVVRVVIQLGTVSVLVTSWGLHRYGDWVILSAIPIYLAFSDIGFTGAAMNEMMMAVGRRDHHVALEVFRSVSLVLTVLFAALALILPVIVVVVPVSTVLNLSTLSNGQAGWIVTVLGVDSLLTTYAGLFYGGFAAVGRYGEGGMIATAILLAEFSALAGVALAGGSPVPSATAMFVAQLIGTVGMYFAMRRRAPWLSFGKPDRIRPNLKRLFTPALASGAFPGALILNIQVMVLVIGLALGPASAAVFSTLRTLSRGVVQIMSSIFAVVTPEISRAFGERDLDFLRVVHRRACQLAIWLGAILVVAVALLGGPIMHVWTSGRIGTGGLLIYILLAGAAVDSVWYSSFGMLYATNRHQRVVLYFSVASILCLPVAYGLIQAWGLDGAACALLGVEVSMLFPVLRRALPIAHDSARSWASFVLRPPISRGVLLRLRRQGGEAGIA